MRVLIIDNNIDRDSWGSAELKDFVVRNPSASAFVRRGPHDDLPNSPHRFDRLIISGSKTSCLEMAPWVEHEDELIKKFVDAGKPVLGVCYGHQALNRTLGGIELLGQAPTPEYGWIEIEVVHPSPLFAGLPTRFHTFSSHREQVHTLAPGFVLTARSKDCAIQACQLGDRPVFGIQFHPERALEGAQKSFKRVKQIGEIKNLFGDGQSEKLFNAEVGEKIFGNFLKL